MPYFFYKAKNQSGETISGELESISENIVAENLKKAGLYPFFIKEKESQIKQKMSNKKFDLLSFTRQMYILIKSGIPLSRALKTMEMSSSEPIFKLMFGEIKAGLDSGYEFYISLQKHPKIFTKFYVNMVRIGEMTGKLEDTFSELYTFLDFEQEIKGKARSALSYPILVLGSMVLAFTMLMIFVIPTFEKIYGGFGAQLPLPTRILIGTSNFMISYGFILLVLIVGSIYMFLTYIKTDMGSFWWGKFKFKIPIIGDILKKIVLARFSKSFSLSLKSGIPVVQSLSMVAYILENSYFEKNIEMIRDSIERGNTLYNSMKNLDSFEPLVLEMIATGEESGELDAMCDEISYMYDKDINYQLKNLSSYIEPIMLLIMGAMVLVLALGIFLPTWDLGSVILKK